MSYRDSGAAVMPSTPIAIRPKRSRPQLRLLECCWMPEQAETLLLSRIALRHVADIFDGRGDTDQAAFFDDTLRELENIIVDARHLRNGENGFLGKWNDCIGIIQEQFEMPQLFTEHLQEAELIFTAFVEAETKPQTDEPFVKSRPAFFARALRHARFGLAALLIAHNPQTAAAAFSFVSEAKAWVNGDMITDEQVIRYFHSNPALCASGDRGERPAASQFALAKAQFELEILSIISEARHKAAKHGQPVTGDIQPREIYTALKQRLGELEGRGTAVKSTGSKMPSISISDWQSFTSPCCLTSSGQVVFIRRKRDEPSPSAVDAPAP